MTLRPVHRLARRHLPLLLLWLPVTGCGGGWATVPLAPPAPYPARQQFQVWRGGAMVQLKGIAVTGDSLSGIPWLKPLDCASCRVTFARTSVDSLCTGSPEGGFIATLLIGVIAVFLGTCIMTEGECYSGGAT